MLTIKRSRYPISRRSRTSGRKTIVSVIGQKLM